ncbi:MAG: antitoxin [Candidatus Pacebacteria bacterium]|jgi:predicted DNA binding CopG/RHH family protein|nr:antitoxin [Candidatus Paceibacterota bacterium]
MKHIFKLTKEEKVMEARVNRADIKPVTKVELVRLQEIARNTTAKNKTITVRLSERDLTKLKTKAMQEGIPYQTYVASLIHKYS